jgi:hypothetical protein
MPSEIGREELRRMVAAGAQAFQPERRFKAGRDARLKTVRHADRNNAGAATGYKRSSSVPA